MSGGPVDVDKLKNIGSGWRTYGIALALVVSGVLVALGKVHLEPETASALVATLVGAGMAALRAGSKNDARDAVAGLLAGILTPDPAAADPPAEAEGKTPPNPA